MGAAKDVLAEIHAIWGQLKTEGHKEADRLHAAYKHLHDLLPGVEAEVKADAEQVAHDAVVAEAPVANEAMQDVAAVADHAGEAVTAPETKSA